MSYLSHRNTRHISIQSYSSRILLGAVSLIFSQFAFSDATVVYEQSTSTQKSINSMQIKDGKIRFTPPNQNSNYSLYDSNKGSLTHVDVVQKKYLVMDEKDIEQQASQAKKQMDAMRQRMLDRMKDMPPEQKKQVEQMMNNHLSRVEDKKNPNKLEQKKTSRTETISGIQCTIYENYLQGLKNSELCIVDADKIGLSNEDAKALMAMQEFMKRMQKVAQEMMGASAQSNEINGIPLRTKLFAQDGSVKLETRLTSLSTDVISSETVSIPSDFQVMTMPKLPGM